jgi:hypothetical protein
MAIKKTYKIIMSPTYKRGAIWKFDASEALIPVQGIMKSDLPFKKYDLYIISDDEIKDGYLFDDKKGACKFISNSDIENTIYVDYGRGAEKFILSNCKKIIASSDKEITPQTWIGNSFINDYVNASNEKNPINEIELEYEPKTQKLATGEEVMGSESEHNLKIKTEDDNSTVVIHSPKLTYTRNEVIEAIHNYREFAWINGSTLADCDKWLKENLK